MVASKMVAMLRIVRLLIARGVIYEVSFGASQKVTLHKHTMSLIKSFLQQTRILDHDMLVVEHSLLRCFLADNQ